VLLEELPRMGNGKIDRGELPAVEAVQEAGGERSVARTVVEEVLAGIWSEVLGVREVSVSGNFFEMGGHSLLATQVMSRVREAFGVEMAVRSLFSEPTVRGLAAMVEQEMKERLGVVTPAIKRVGRDGEMPLSYAQQRLWFADQMTPDSALYNVASALRLNGALNVSALEETLREIIRRHEVLRTSFPASHGEPVQVISPTVDFTLPLLDLSTMEQGERESSARRMAQEEAVRPFDLSCGPLLRAGLIKLTDHEHIVMLTMHHIISDGWSMGVLIKEVGALYEAYAEGKASPLRELEIQYGDYAVWQREWLSGEVLEGEVGYWREQLRGAPGKIELPVDRERPLVQSFHGAHQTFSLTPELSRGLRELSGREGATLFMTLLAGFQLQLHYYTGQHDIVIGTNVANRNRGETESLIGFFVNTLALRTDLSGDPNFLELLKRVQDVCLGAYAHQDVPFEKVVAALQSERDLSRSPLFQVKIEFSGDLMKEFELPGMKLSPLGSSAEVVRYDLHLFFAEREQALMFQIVYPTDLFESKTIKMMGKQLEMLLSIVLAEPETKLSVVQERLAEAERDNQAMRERKAKEARLMKFQQVKRKAVDELPV
jgi:acyl carrier protein